MAPNHRKQEGHQAQTEGGLSFVPVCAKCSHVQSKQNKNRFKKPQPMGDDSQARNFLKG